jgi:hypothetical protein
MRATSKRAIIVRSRGPWRARRGGSIFHRRSSRPAGGIGPGAVFHIREAFARNAEWSIDVLTDVTGSTPGGSRTDRATSGCTSRAWTTR